MVIGNNNFREKIKKVCMGGIGCDIKYFHVFTTAIYEARIEAASVTHLTHQP
jgi:hypothetical protein